MSDTDGFEGQQMHCPNCDDEVPETWDEDEYTRECPECGNVAYDSEAEYEGVLSEVLDDE